MIRKITSVVIIALTAGMCLVTGCSQEVSSVSNAQEISGKETDSSGTGNYYYLPVGSYDSADTAILEKINETDETVTLYNTTAARNYTLSYDGTTYVSDKYGTAMSMAQMREGTIVNVNFLKSEKKLVDIQVSPDAWCYEDVQKYNLAGINSTATIGDQTYALSDGVQIFSEGENAKIENIVLGDRLTVSGIGYDIFSITVENGHGYVRLSNDEALIGGWIEIGSELITKVTDANMLLSVPEGSYTVRIYNNNQSITQDIIVERNQEVVLDCSEITVPQVDYGLIKFNVTPDTATLKLDGEEQDISGVIKASYGIHAIEVSASGYDTLSKYINVGEESAEITINLQETSTYVSGNGTSSSTGNTTSSTTTTTTTTTKKTTSGNGSTSGNSSGDDDDDDKEVKKTTLTVSGNTFDTSNSTLTYTGSGTQGTIGAGSNIVYLYTPDGSEVYYDGTLIDSPGAEILKVAGSHTITLVKDGKTYSSFTIYLNDDGQDVAISFPENKY